MKKSIFQSAAFVAAIVFAAALFSFGKKPGGDVFEIYLNGKQVLQQFVHIDKSVKTLAFNVNNDNDRIGISYSHCGYAGKNRIVTVKDEKNKLVKELKFPDANNQRSIMSFTLKDLAGMQQLKNTKLNLYYASKELPEGRLLATIQLQNGERIVKL